mmetsp:Transcript_12542/g.25203  ORF Transcript_12542/g.25203 Transcript_12542/m.25203 type:complete len:96 (-) Transcript_12542:203-490(-)
MVTRLPMSDLENTVALPALPAALPAGLNGEARSAIEALNSPRGLDSPRADSTLNGGEAIRSGTEAAERAVCAPPRWLSLAAGSTTDGITGAEEAV